MMEGEGETSRSIFVEMYFFNFIFSIWFGFILPLVDPGLTYFGLLTFCF